MKADAVKYGAMIYMLWFTCRRLHAAYSGLSYIKEASLTKIFKKFQKISKIFPDFFFHKTLQYGHRSIPLDPSIQDLTF